ncbi:MAG: hypothetical protein U0133_13015 [Gemmatimonadales bacterium]
MLRRLSLLLSLAFAAPVAATAQVPVFVAGQAGGAFTTDENTPNGTGSGFAWLGAAGVAFEHLSVGGEYAAYKTGGGGKSEVVGGFARLPTYIGNSPSQLYLVIGLGAYRFRPPTGKASTTAGGSLGPGIRVAFRGSPVAILAEVRFHSTFDKLPRINSQQFIGLTGGLELRL